MPAAIPADRFRQLWASLARAHGDEVAATLMGMFCTAYLWARTPGEPPPPGKVVADVHRAYGVAEGDTLLAMIDASSADQVFG